MTLDFKATTWGGPWLAWQQDYFSCWLLDMVLRLAVSDFLIFFFPSFLRLAERNVIKLPLKGVNLGVTSFSFACIQFAIQKYCFEKSDA